MFFRGVGQTIRKTRFGLVVAIGVLLAAGGAAAKGGSGPPDFQPGAPGLGDSYFPLDGNGGYDAKRYLLGPDLRPRDGRPRRRGDDPRPRDAGPLQLQPRLRRHDGRVDHGRRRAGGVDAGRRGADRHSRGRPARRQHVHDRRALLGDTAPDRRRVRAGGFLATDDGAVIVGQPHVAATWYPVNDHPTDKATYAFEVTVPEGLEAVANGVLKKQRTKHGSTTWRWEPESRWPRTSRR